MTKWFMQIQYNKRIQNLLLISLFALLFYLPENMEIAYIPILFFIAYVSTYIRTSPIWKGLLYSLVVTAIVVVAFLTIITLFPTIPEIFLIIIIGFIAFLCTYFIG
jgi:hypothetical protein